MSSPGTCRKSTWGFRDVIACALRCVLAVFVLTGPADAASNKALVLSGKVTVRCLVSWPATIQAGSTHEGLVDFSDFLPTFAELTGDGLPADSPINGISFAKILLGQTAEARQWIYIHDGWHPNPASQELYEGHSWGGNPKAPPGQKLKARVDPPYSHIKAFRYAFGTRFKLYNDGRLYDLEKDLHERTPIQLVEDFPEARQALEDLRKVLERFPKKEAERGRAGDEAKSGR